MKRLAVDRDRYFMLALRAGLVELPEDYRWTSLGYHVQTNNRDNFLSTDFGLKEFNVKNQKER